MAFFLGTQHVIPEVISIVVSANYVCGHSSSYKCRHSSNYNYRHSSAGWNLCVRQQPSQG